MDMDSVLNQMRREHSPTPADKERLRAGIATAVIVGGVAGAAQLSAATGLETATAVKGVGWLVPVWVKGAVGVGAAVAAVSGGVYGVSKLRTSDGVAVEGRAGPVEHRLSETAAARQVPATTAATTTAATTTVEGKTEVLAPQQPSEVQAASKAVVVSVQRPANSATRTLGGAELARDQVGAAAKAELHSLTSLGELRLIGEASKALREGRTEAARLALAEHERRYSNTTLGQERAGLDLLARCADSKGPETKRAAEEFLRSSPKSPLAGTIRRECFE